jgi:hypothetical protein
MPVDLRERYCAATKDNLHFFGVWPPGSPVELGSYGTLQGAVFNALGSIETKFGIAVRPRPLSPRLQFEFKSTGVTQTNVAVNMFADGTPAGGSSRAMTKLEFKNGGSVFFRTKDAIYTTIANIDEVNNAVMAKFSVGEWDGTYAFVHGFYRAGGTTIIISNEENAQIELEGDVTGGGQLNIADSDAKVSSKSDRDIALNIVAKPGLIPLACLSQIRPRNKWLALLGWSEKHSQPLMATSSEGTQGMLTSDTPLTQLRPLISPDVAQAVNCSVDDLYHVIEIE